jgi:GNAT superfamily N-acetyltransferase
MIFNEVLPEWERGEIIIRTDVSFLQIDTIHKFLSEESYWAKERTREQTQRAIENSLSFGVYKGEKQIGFARVVTDYATFAYIGDVFILNEFRGRGISKWLMETIVNHPDLQNLRRWILATRDAHALYEKFGFTELKVPERWMEKTAPNAY